MGTDHSPTDTGGGRDFFYTKRCYCKSKSQAGKSFLYTKLQAKQVLDGKVEKSQTLFFLNPT